MRLLLIRHAATAPMKDILCGRKPGIHLSAEGQEQARTLGRSLAQISDLEAVYASPLERAAETARAVAEPHSKEVVEEQALNELDFGRWEGRPFSELKDGLWEQYNRLRSTTEAPGGESLIAVQARTWRAVSMWMGQHTGAVAAITHGDVIRALLLLLLGMPADYIFRLEISPASLTTVSVWPGCAPVVHGVNRTFV